MTLLAEPNAAAAAELGSALGRSTTLLTSLDALRDALGNHLDEDVVVIGPNVDSVGAFRLAADYRITRPTLSVILVRRRVETALMSEAMRNGVREIVEERDLKALNEAVQRATALASDLRVLSDGGESPATQRGTIVTVFSAKGGCGKTTVSTNLAAMLAAETDKRVCLVDLDLAFGDVGIALQLVPVHTLADAIAMGPSMDADGLRDLLTEHATGLQVLAAPVGPDSKDSISPGLVTRILDLLAADFDVVIVDTPPAFDDTTLAAFDRTDLLLILTTLDVPAIKNLKVSIETLNYIGFPADKLEVVVNRADAKVGITVSDVQKAIKVPIAARVPSSREVPAATNRGVAITVDAPRHPVSQAIRSLAATHLPHVASQLNEPASSKRSMFRQRGGSPA